MSTTATTTIPASRSLPTERTGLLRLALAADAAVTGANGVAYLALAGPLGDLFDLPAAGLRGAGAFLVAFAIGVGVLARRTTAPRGAVLAVIAVNVLWAADSIVLLAAGWGSPSTAGGVWIALQAVVVAGFAALQRAGLRRA